MQGVEALDRANQTNRLWPPIADAVDTFLKRRSSDADSYERVWRQIHVWEAISITLVGAGVSRVRCYPELTAVFLKCREQLHGRTWNSVTSSFDYFSGALDGSALARLNILHELSNVEASDSSFLTALQGFLTAKQISAVDLVDAWARICDVPDQWRRGERIEVRAVMRLMNEFRNRIAHVPFPYDGLDELCDALEDLSGQLFCVEPQPWQAFADGRSESPLCGSLLWRKRVLYGSAHRANLESVEGLRFSYPIGRKPSDKRETWRAEPFAFIDSMLRPFVLTRLRAPATGIWEFTRYRAEANAVFYHEAADWQSNIAPPTESEYVTPEAEREQAEEREIVESAATAAGADQTTEPNASRNEFEHALRLIRNQEYVPAMEYFARLVSSRPDYHIGWLRLGNVQRELAMRTRSDDAAEAKRLFDQSIDSLTHAAGHSYSDRAAQAFYERSKAHYHRGRLTDIVEDYNRAVADVERALGRHCEPAYESWLAYLKSHPPKNYPPESPTRLEDGG